MGLFDFFHKKTTAVLPFHTDVHCHLVPAVDDGSPDMPTSLLLLEEMHNMGLNRIFISPHMTQEKYENTKQSLMPHFDALLQAASQAGIPVEMHLHTENRIDAFFLQQLTNHNLLMLPGNRLLIENPFIQEPMNLRELIYDLRQNGITPILAHPERYDYYYRVNPEQYFQLSQAGLQFQINLLSLAGQYGRIEREVALELLANGLVQWIGTDIHRPAHIKTIQQYLLSSHARRDLKLIVNLQNDSL